LGFDGAPFDRLSDFPGAGVEDVSDLAPVSLDFVDGLAPAAGPLASELLVLPASAFVVALDSDADAWLPASPGDVPAGALPLSRLSLR